MVNIWEVFVSVRGWAVDVPMVVRAVSVLFALVVVVMVLVVRVVVAVFEFFVDVVMLALGKALGADIVCAGNARWHTKSVWVTLGPKTKADCTVDVMIVNVKSEEIEQDAKNVKADSTRKEAGLETAASLLISMGFTALSGGPKTPHQQRAAQIAIGLAMEPWLKTTAASRRKIS
jgi:hypothetical protein